MGCEKYFISLKPLTMGTYLVHSEGCPFLPEKEKVYLGKFRGPEEAMRSMVRGTPKLQKCIFCSPGKESESDRYPGELERCAASVPGKGRIPAGPEVIFICALN